MPTSQAPKFNRAGFSLIEVLIATAIAALVIGAAATSIIGSEKNARAGAFYRAAMLSAQRAHAEYLGILIDQEPPESAVIEKTFIGGAEGRPGWRVCEINDPDSGRRLTTCFLD